MTEVIFQGSIKEVARRTMQDKAANELLRFIKSTDTFAVNGSMMQFTDSYIVVHRLVNGYNSLYILGNEVSVND